jgi:hypothetical protein
VDRLREVMTDSGALGVVEGMITDLSARAMAAAVLVDAPARGVLEQLVAAATDRSQ